MADFDPDAFLATKPKPAGFDPDSFLKSDPIADMADPSKNPDYLRAQADAVKLRNSARAADAAFAKANQEAGFQLDLESPLPAGLRSRVSFDSNADKQLELVKKQEGVISARKAKGGDNIIVRVAGEDGKPKDVLLHPRTSTLTMGDIAGAAGPIAKAAPVIAASFFTGGLPLLTTAGVLGGTAAASEIAGSGGSRVLAGQDIDPKDLALAGAKEGAINAALPLAGAAAKATGKGVSNLFRAGEGQLERTLPAAAARLGVDTTVTETTGSPALAKLGKLTPAEEDARQMALRVAKDREVVLGGGSPGPLSSESDIAKTAQPIFAADAAAAEKGARDTMTAAERTAQRELEAQLNSGLIPAGASNSAVGANTRKKFEDFVAKVQADAATNYPLFHEQAAKEGIVLDKSPFTDLVAEIEKKDPHLVEDLLAPSVRQVKTVEQKLTQPLAEAKPSGLVDARGNPIMTTEVPSPPLTFEEAIRQRAIIRTKLNAPQDPLGDVVKTYYKRLEKAYTEAIDDGLKRGSPELNKLYDTARGSYAAGADALERGVVQKLFREAGEAGRVPDENVVKQLFSGDGKLEALRDIKNILGASSADYRTLVRQGVQNMIDDAAAKGSGGLIDVKAFLTKFNGLDKEMRAEMFGALEKPLKATADAMEIAQKGAAGAAKIPADELADALASAPGSVRRLIDDAVKRQKIYEAEYTNGIMQRLTGKTLGIKDLGNLDRFVSDFVPAASAADMRQILTRIEAASPGGSEQIRKRVLQDILDTSRATGALGKQTTREVEDLSHQKLAPYLTGAEREKYQAILGQRGIQFLDDLATYAEVTAKRQAAEIGHKVTPEVLAKEGTSGFLGFKRNAVGALVDIAAPVVRVLGGGNAVRNEAVRRYLETGVLPTFGLEKPAVRAMVLAAPEAERVREKVLAGKP